MIWIFIFYILPMPCSSRFTAVPYSFYFHTMDWTMLQEMPKNWDIVLQHSPALNASVTSSLTCLIHSHECHTFQISAYAIVKVKSLLQLVSTNLCSLIYVSTWNQKAVNTLEMLFFFLVPGQQLQLEHRSCGSQTLHVTTVCCQQKLFLLPLHLLLHCIHTHIYTKLHTGSLISKKEAERSKAGGEQKSSRTRAGVIFKETI